MNKDIVKKQIYMNAKKTGFFILSKMNGTELNIMRANIGFIPITLSVKIGK